MCIRDRRWPGPRGAASRTVVRIGERYDPAELTPMDHFLTCLLYTSDAADDLLCVDLGGRRIIKKKKKTPQTK